MILISLFPIACVIALHSTMLRQSTWREYYFFVFQNVFFCVDLLFVTKRCRYKVSECFIRLNEIVNRNFQLLLLLIIIDNQRLPILTNEAPSKLSERDIDLCLMRLLLLKHLDRLDLFVALCELSQSSFTADQVVVLYCLCLKQNLTNFF